MTKNEVINYIKKQSLGTFLQLDRQKKGYVCPYCQNGTGSTGDGIRLIPNSNYLYKCFKCGKSGDIFSFIGEYFKIHNFNDQLKKAMEIYGVTIDEHSNSTKNIIQSPNVLNSVTVSKDVSSYLNDCHELVNQTDFFTKRGISKQSIDKFNLGFDPHFTEGTGGKVWKAIIIPTSSETFEARNINIEPNSENLGNCRYRKHGSTKIFNVSALTDEKEKPIFICEGSIDAISIIQSGGQAIALGSANNYPLLLKELQNITPKKPLIITFDPDETGIKHSKTLAEELEKLNIPYIQAPNVIGDYHDPNDRFLKDNSGFCLEILKAMERTTKIKTPTDIEKENYLKTSVSQCIEDFKAMISASASKPKLSTGFSKIDHILDGGLYTGLYIIGAISSLGKTTLTLQIADNLAQQGIDVLFFSLEQSKFELMSKSISRETFIFCKQHNLNINVAKSNLSILDGHRWKNYTQLENKVLNSAFNKYKNYSQNIFIHEGIGNISVSKIKDTIKKHISFTENKNLVVFIDYLQILSAPSGFERFTDKQIVDHNVTALKQLSRDFDIPIVVVSSLNRQNYFEEINMTSFKESGAIEYSSDVLIGLQLKGTGKNSFDLISAKEKNPREIEFCILKYRNGKVSSKGAELKYYPEFNYFETSNESLSSNSVSKKLLF